jgi:hypothetical protein
MGSHGVAWGRMGSHDAWVAWGRTMGSHGVARWGHIRGRMALHGGGMGGSRDGEGGLCPGLCPPPGPDCLDRAQRRCPPRSLRIHMIYYKDDILYISDSDGVPHLPPPPSTRPSNMEQSNPTLEYAWPHTPIRGGPGAPPIALARALLPSFTHTHTHTHTRTHACTSPFPPLGYILRDTRSLRIYRI